MRAVWITNAECLITTHLWAGPCGSLTHTEHWLVLDAIQPTNRKAGAADPSHHGDVAVSEEAMQKMIHGGKDWTACEGTGLCRGSGDVKETYMCNHAWPVVPQVFMTYSAFTFTNKHGILPGSEGVGGHHLQSVSRTIQIHHEQTNRGNAWAGLWSCSKKRKSWIISKKSIKINK